MRWRVQQKLLFVLLSICGSCGISASAEGPQSTRWQQVPLPPSSRSPSVRQIATERGGDLWVLAGGEVYYWAGDGLRVPGGDKLRSDVYLARLLGGKDRDLYLSQGGGGKEHHGKIYRLSDGVAQYVTDFYFEVSHLDPGLYVSPAGHIINWGKRFLSVYVDGRWHQREALLGSSGVTVAEGDGKVFVCYHQKLYVIDKKGKIKEHDLDFGESIKLKQTPAIADWGKDRILALCRGGLFAFNVRTGRQVNVKDIWRQLEGRRVIDFFSVASGAIWLRTTNERGKDYAFYGLSADGGVERIRTTIELTPNNVRYRQYSRSVLHASDGAVWVAAEDGSITRFHNGTSRVFNWQHGLNFGKCSYVLEGRDGSIYIAAGEGILVWRPDGPEQPLADWVKAWQEYRTASYHPIRDRRGHVWMLLADHPGEISRWNGKRWHHQPFPDKTIYHGMADDQGHVLLEGSGVCFDVSRRGVTSFANLKEALVAAQARGVKRIDTDETYQGCLILDTGEIWFGYHNLSFVSRYDGQRWDEFYLKSSIGNVHESAEHGVLIRTQGDKFYKYDRGKLELVTELSGHNRLLWSSKKFQPFESALLKRHPRDFVVLEDRQAAIAVREVSDEGKSRTVYKVGDPLPRYPSTLTRGRRYGHWTNYQAGWIYRIWGNRVIKCDWHETPMLNRWGEIRQVIEDRAGNLWTFTSGYTPQVFMKRMNDFRISATDDGAGTITVTPDTAWHGHYVPRVFWRTDKGPWQGGEEKSEIVLPPDRDAAIEIVAMDRQGGTTSPTHIEVHARPSAVND